MPALGLGPYQYSMIDPEAERLRMNLIKSVTDTYVSIIARNKPKPRALTNDGDWSLRKKAKGLTRWWEGKAADLDLYRDISDPCCLASGVFGLGAAKVYREWPAHKDLWDVGVEYAFPWELIADDAEWYVPKRARNLAQRKVYDRTVLSEMFPKEKAWIMSSAERLGEESSMARLRGGVGGRPSCLVYELSALAELATRGRRRTACTASWWRGKTLYEGASGTGCWFPFAFCYRDRPSTKGSSVGLSRGS